MIEITELLLLFSDYCQFHNTTLQKNSLSKSLRFAKRPCPSLNELDWTTLSVQLLCRQGVLLWKV